MDKALELCLRSDLKHANARIAQLETDLAKAQAKRDGYRAKMEEFESKWAETEEQLAEARRDSDRLTHIIEQSNNGRGWLEDDVWDKAADLWYRKEDSGDVQKWVRAVIDADTAARGAK